MALKSMQIEASLSNQNRHHRPKERHSFPSRVTGEHYACTLICSGNSREIDKLFRGAE